MLAILVSLFVAFAAAPAAAKTQAKRDTNDAAVGVSAACRKELRGVCRPAPRRSPLACLKAHESALSKRCRAALDASKDAALPAAPTSADSPAARRSCLPAIMKLCRGRRGADFYSCLKSRRDEAPESCRPVVDGMVKAAGA